MDKHQCECGATISRKSLARHLKSKKHLEGAGLVDWIKKGVSAVKDVFSIRDGYNNTAKDTIKKYGDWKITKINVYRKPIEKALEVVLDLVSGGKFTQAKKDANYDKLFHLGMFLILNDEKGNWVNVICEKNEVINLKRVSFDISKAGENITVHFNKDVKLNQFLDNSEHQMGNKYFKYDAFGGNNCQVFVKSCLMANGLYTKEIDSFVFQPLEKVIKTLPKSTPFIAKAVTTLGAWFNKILGKGKPHHQTESTDGLVIQSVRVRKPATREQAERHADNILKNRKKRTVTEKVNWWHVRALPKTKIEKGTFVTKKVNSNIQLVFGRLKGT